MIEDTTTQQKLIYEQFFSKLTQNQVIEFAAWCITPFFEDARIIDFLNGINAEVASKIQRAFLGVENATDLVEFFNEGVFLEVGNTTWFSDDYSGYDFDASEGAVKLLAAVECLMRYHKTSQKEWAVESASQFLEQLDYYLMLVEGNDALTAWMRELKGQEIDARTRCLAALECNGVLSMKSIPHANHAGIVRVYTYR